MSKYVLYDYKNNVVKSFTGRYLKTNLPFVTIFDGGRISAVLTLEHGQSLVRFPDSASCPEPDNRSGSTQANGVVSTQANNFEPKPTYPDGSCADPAALSSPAMTSPAPVWDPATIRTEHLGWLHPGNQFQSELSKLIKSAWAEEKHEKLVNAVRDLYYAAFWTPDRKVDAKSLWEKVRDAAGFEPGLSPTRIQKAPAELRVFTGFTKYLVERKQNGQWFSIGRYFVNHKAAEAYIAGFHDAEIDAKS